MKTHFRAHSEKMDTTKGNGLNLLQDFTFPICTGTDGGKAAKLNIQKKNMQIEKAQLANVEFPG